METAIQKLKGRYILISKLSYSSERSICFYKVKEFIKGARCDFTWNDSPFLSKKETPMFGTLYLSFTALPALLSSISSFNMEYIENRFTKRKWIRNFSDEMRLINICSLIMNEVLLFGELTK